MKMHGMMILLMGLGCGSTDGDVRASQSSTAEGGNEPLSRASEVEQDEQGRGMRPGHGMRGGSMGGGGHGMRGGGMGGGGHGMRGGGMGGGGHGMRGGGMGGGAPAEIRDTLHALLDHHEAIVRNVEEQEDGIASVTTSEDPEVVALIREHVREIAAHVEGGGAIRRWDPLFEALGEHYQEMSMEIRDVPGGVAVIHRGTTPAAVALIKEHARVVSGFAEHGYDEAHREHPRPATAP